MGYVDGSLPAPEATITETTTVGEAQVPNPAYVRWMQQDQMVLSTLLSSLSPEILAQVLLLSTAHEVWVALERMYSSSSRANIIQIRMQLATLHKKDLTTAAYFYKVKGLADSLAAAGQPLRTDEIISYMLAGLDSDYDAFVTSVTTRAEPMGLNDLYAHLLSYEMRQDRHNSGASVNMISRGNRGGHGRGRGRQGPPPHIQSPGRGVGGNSSSGSGGTGGRPICQICGKTGHVALRCYNRFNHSYQAEEGKVAAAAINASASYDVDPSWYADTGATDHITSELEKPSMKEKYSVNEQVHTANGTERGAGIWTAGAGD